MQSGKLTEIVRILKRKATRNAFGEDMETFEEGSRVFMGVNSLAGTYRQVEGVGVQDYDVVFTGRYYLYVSGIITDGTVLRWNGHEYRVESIGLTSDSRMRNIVTFKCNRINQ